MATPCPIIISRSAACHDHYSKQLRDQGIPILPWDEVKKGQRGKCFLWIDHVPHCRQTPSSCPKNPTPFHVYWGLGQRDAISVFEDLSRAYQYAIAVRDYRKVYEDSIGL